MNSAYRTSLMPSVITFGALLGVICWMLLRVG